MLRLMFTYDFDYSWPLRWGHLLIAMAGAALALLGWRFGWRRSSIVTSGLLSLWGVAGAIAMHYAVQIASPQRLATESFIPAGRGEVLELGAGSGRATIGLLLARPQARVTALDAYRGYFGIDDNTPERLMRNARAAGVDKHACTCRWPTCAGFRSRQAASTRPSAWPPSITCPGTALRRR